MNALYLDIASRLGRTALQIGGTWLATHGYMGADDFSAVSGAVIALGTTVWTVYAAHKASQPATPANATTGGLL